MFGPTGASKRQEIVNRAAIEVVYKPLSSAPGAAEKEKESVLRQIAEAAVMTQLHPRTVVQIVVQEQMAVMMAPGIRIHTTMYMQSSQGPADKLRDD